MTVSDVQWAIWLNVLEEMLYDADAHGETMFAIHLNTAIETAYIRSGNARSGPNSDQQFSATRDR